MSAPTHDDARLEGLHHVTMITGDAQANVDFFVGVLGLRLVKRTVNFDAPDMYHLYYGDDAGAPGSLLTWFEIRGARPGRAGAGMVHLLELGVPSAESLAFWADRLAAAGVEATRTGDRLAFADPDGLGLALVVASPDHAPLQASHPQVPSQHAITGIEGARAYGRASDDAALLDAAFGFTDLGDGEYEVRGRERSCRWGYDEPPAAGGVPGAGTVHHIAWCSRDAEHEHWQARERAAGLHATPIIDRDYFDAVYTRVPGGVMFEIATMGPGFAVDEDPAHLGEELRVPKQYASHRAQIEQVLSPLVVPTEGSDR